MCIGADELAAISDICTRLDGIPLAIELAAARCRALTPVQIAERLAGHLDMLSGGSRRALPRHRALEASIEWSHNLLGDDERALLHRLSVFAGGFDLVAAEAVGADECTNAWAVVELLTGLVDKSLVLQDTGGRYRLLETVRQFAEARLAAAGNAGPVRRVHAEHFRALAQAAEDSLYGNDIVATRRRLRVDMDNLRAAADFAIASGDADLALGLLVPIDLFWQGVVGEARDLLRRALLVPGGSVDLRMRGYAAAAEIECVCGAMEGLAQFAVAGLELVDEDTDPGVHGWLREQVGWVRFFGGEEGGGEAWAAGLELLRQADSPRMGYYVLDALWGVAFNQLAQGRTAEGLATLAESADWARTIDTFIGTGRSTGIEGTFRAVCGDLTGTRRLLTDSAAMLTECEDEMASWFVCAGVMVSGLAGEGDARDRLHELLGEARARNEGFAIAWGAWGLALLEARLDPPPADWSAAIDEAVAWMRGVGFLWGAPWAQALRAQHLAAAGKTDAARAEIASALSAVGATTRAELARGVVHLARARVALAAGEPAEAEEAAQFALATLTKTGLGLQAVEALELLAGLAAAGSPAEAVRMYAAAASTRTVLAFPPAPAESTRLDGGLDRARALLDPSAYESAWAEGAQLTLAEAATYAARGRGPRRRPSSGWHSLTPTELEVVDLVAAGLSNPQIAAKLFVSAETIKTHVGNLLAKLGAANRVELAAQAARRESAP